MGTQAMGFVLCMGYRAIVYEGALVAAFAYLFAEGFDVEGMSMTAKASLHAAAWSQLLSTRVPSMSERTASTM